MLDEAAVQDILDRQLQLSPGRYEITPLRGDASNRKYYRLYPANHGHACPRLPPPAGRAESGQVPDRQGHSIIVMELAEPEAFKKSEEQVSASRIPIRELPYINILKHLRDCQVAVPELYYYEEKRGWLFLEDLGDITLWEELKGADLEMHRRYYTQAIDELLKIQVQGTRLANPGCIAFGRAFDVPLLMWEFDHFLEYGVEVYKKKKITPEDRREIRVVFEEIAQSLAAEPRYFTHRDYHSRNLMIHAGRIRVLDFQDALMGPAQYDLASLLRDSYLSLPDDLIKDLLDYYLDQKQVLEGVAVDRQRFLRLFDWMSIQRNLKAAGRFAYIDAVKGNPNYLQFIPHTLGNVKKNLAKYPETRELKVILSHYVEELK
jgi:aminoglycoside/choline kinase family phosphotransferase